jgi:hypothetical protein
MNSYLEQVDVWEDFHASFIPILRAMLEAEVPAHYIVKIETRLYRSCLTNNVISWGGPTWA